MLDSPPGRGRRQGPSQWGRSPPASRGCVQDVSPGRGPGTSERLGPGAGWQWPCLAGLFQPLGRAPWGLLEALALSPSPGTALPRVQQLQQLQEAQVCLAVQLQDCDQG